MLRDVALAPFGDGCRVTVGMKVGERILAHVDAALDRERLGPCRSGFPVRESTDSEPAFPARPRPVVDDESSSPCRSDAAAEALHLAVVGDPVARGRRFEPFDEDVCEFHGVFRVRSMSGERTARRVPLLASCVRRCQEISTSCQRLIDGKQRKRNVLKGLAKRPKTYS